MLPESSLAVRVVIGTMVLLTATGMVNAVTVGADGLMMTTAVREFETLPALSFAQAYNVWLPVVPVAKM